MINRFKFDIISTTYNPELSKKIRELWYERFPNYAVDVDKDRAASEVIVGFLKQQFVLKSLDFNEKTMLASMNTIIDACIIGDDFWAKKSLRTISNNMQEFVNIINTKKHGRDNNSGRVKKTPVPTIKPKGGFGSL